ncbi:WD40 repeat domain-containing protein [Candidatus Gracilibacteria bacterium]|nr:WD40 repeat domain-containing protein [Candidatus Gracilibacteria bacterium]
MSLLGIGLQPCRWLDRWFSYSGCVYSIAIERASIRSLTFAPDGATIAVGGSDGLLQIYAADDGSLLTSLHQHNAWVTSVAFSPDGSLLASADWDGEVRIWRSSDWKLLTSWRVQVTHGSGTMRLAFAPDGRTLASATRGQMVQLWEPTSGRLLQELHATEALLAFSPDGSLLAVGQPESVITLYRQSDWQAIALMRSHRYNITDLAFSQDGQRLYSSSQGDGALHAWRLADGALITNAAAPAGSTIALSLDGRWLASGGAFFEMQGLNGALALTELNTDLRTRSWLADDAPVESVAFSPDSSLLASGSWNTLRLWRVRG